MQDSFDEDKSTGFIESSKSPRRETAFQFFQEVVPRGMLDGSGNQRGSKVLGWELSKREAKNADYVALD